MPDNTPKTYKKHRSLYMQLVFVTFAFTLMVCSSYYFVRNSERINVELEAEETFSNVESQLLANLFEFENRLEVVSNTVRQMLLQGAELDEIKAYMVTVTAYEAKAEHSGNFLGYFAGFGADGLDGFNALMPDLNWDEIKASGYNPKERPWYITAEASGDKTAVTEPYIDEISKEVTITYVRNIYDNDGNRLAIICLDVLLDRAYKISLKHRNNFGSDWSLFDKNLFVLAHENADFVGKHISEIDSGITGCLFTLEQNGFVSNYSATDYLGNNVLFSIRPLENGWFLGVKTNMERYNAILSDILQFLIALGSLLTILLIVILIRINAAKEHSEYELLKANAEKNTLIHLGTILNEISAIICITDPATDTFLFINNKMREVFEIGDNYTSDKCYKLFLGYDKKCEYCPCDDLNLNPDKEIIWERSYAKTNRIYLCYSRYVKWPTGQTVHIQHAIDITERKENERKITEANKLLETALHNEESSNKAKSAFLANMSHELRTPMNAILGITEIQLQNGNLAPETAEALKHIYESGGLLLNIVNDILDLSKIEAGKLEIIPVKYTLPELVNDTVQLNRLRYDSKPIKFILEVDESAPLNLFGDELRIKQILCNILSNAFKYTDKGEVKMSVSYEARQTNNATLIFRISDTGQGMTEEQLETLYADYTRFNSKANRAIVGTGLGMSITKRLLDLLNGEITVKSEPGKGTVFTVRIPQKRTDALVCGSETAKKLQSFSYQSANVTTKSGTRCGYMPYGKVLVVDDVSTNIYVAKGMLLPYGLQIDTAESGLEAIDKIKAGNEYDIVFMDHMMPESDGVETTKILRDMGYTKPIIALTANAIVGQAEMFLQNGFDGYISKPIDSREMDQILNDFIQNKKPPNVKITAKADKHETQPAATPHPKQNPAQVLKIKRCFISDAEKAVSVLKNINCNNIGETEINLYITTVHGIKSALTHIGEAELSAAAKKLEEAAMQKNFSLIKEETPKLITELEAVIENIKD